MTVSSVVMTRYTNSDILYRIDNINININVNVNVLHHVY